MTWLYLGEFLSTSPAARKSLSLASASTQKTYRYFSGRSSRLTNGDRQASASATARKAMATRQQGSAALHRKQDIGIPPERGQRFGIAYQLSRRYARQQ